MRCYRIVGSRITKIEVMVIKIWFLEDYHDQMITTKFYVD
jgi:hypothetical protein